ncbi:hypothetical protein DFA_04543 [Cavenderia fasciculata]|uniref:Uncharacterized protein n=1 Tax=Cavenderia fasciculata TaxID=261658 RepID=F4PPV9_CACFS|nr:uncharacterized protein DFA_04543 [Cavenderia fasciculata]EGG22422.1 hypothetical protein DFA_04543 [Cavenderia fasciculata]|eukprot:XP_004360273.1 hypothetical protein DFA_04543 [Cavenderia fasciculata]
MDTSKEEQDPRDRNDRLIELSEQQDQHRLLSFKYSMIRHIQDHIIQRNKQQEEARPKGSGSATRTPKQTPTTTTAPTGPRQTTTSTRPTHPPSLTSLFSTHHQLKQQQLTGRTTEKTDSNQLLYYQQQLKLIEMDQLEKKLMKQVLLFTNKITLELILNSIIEIANLIKSARDKSDNDDDSDDVDSSDDDDDDDDDDSDRDDYYLQYDYCENYNCKVERTINRPTLDDQCGPNSGGRFI